MTIYTCAPEWEAMLSCIYEAFAGKKGHANIRLLTEPVDQYTLFDEYIHVDADTEKAGRMMDVICQRISQPFFRELSYCSMAYEQDVAEVIYHVILLGLNLGPQALQMVQYKDVMRFVQIRKRVGSEAHHFREFLRFHKLGDDLYVAHFEPKSRVVDALGANFADRMPSENFMIVDDIHLEAVIHPKNEMFYHRKLTKEELKRLLETEKENDEYTDMWRVFFNTIAIKERANAKCQQNMFPLWKRKHAVEFFESV